jgi:hypothetical protein
MPGGLVLASQAGSRMMARQTYRTINRMERRREMPRPEPDDGQDTTPRQPMVDYPAPPPPPRGDP